MDNLELLLAFLWASEQEFLTSVVTLSDMEESQTRHLNSLSSQLKSRSVGIILF